MVATVQRHLQRWESLLSALEEMSPVSSKCCRTTDSKKSWNYPLRQRMCGCECTGDPMTTVHGFSSFPWIPRGAACDIRSRLQHWHCGAQGHVYSSAGPIAETDNSICGLGYAFPSMSVSMPTISPHGPSNIPPGMVLFYCTAIAMKRQDQTVVAESLVDLFDLEKIVFSGQVISCITGQGISNRI